MDGNTLLIMKDKFECFEEEGSYIQVIYSEEYNNIEIFGVSQKEPFCVILDEKHARDFNLMLKFAIDKIKDQEL